MAVETRENLPAAEPPIRVSIAIVRRGDDVLICQRKSDAVLGGFWEFPGGKLLAHETPPAAAVREVTEELGIHVVADRALEVITFTYPHGTVELHPILCDYRSGEPQALGCANWKWLPAHDLRAADFPPANAALIERLRTGTA
jgi:mutator protein MutT